MNDAKVKGLFGGTVDLKPRGALAERFGVVPFSVLSARDGWWQDRKRAWLALGIQSELGRGEALIGGSSLYSGDDPKYGNRGPRVRKDGTVDPTATAEGALCFNIRADAYKNRKVSPGGSPRPAMKLGKDGKTVRGDGAGKPLYVEGSNPDGLNITITADAYRKAGQETTTAAGTGTSIFDPVLCECVYRWWTPPGGQVVDSFAGGSVRGIVAGYLGRPYWGCDLSKPQVKANRQQAEVIPTKVKPEWVIGDSLEKLKDAPDADLFFSCPPYGSLEQYSDDPSDISNMPDEEFDRVYAAIIRRGCKRLRQDRFAVFVVGDYRDKAGCYRGLPELTVAAFAAAGLRKYNEAILVTAAGSLPIRASAQFEGSRKLGKTHQQCLVFVKGDPRKAAAACASEVK